ncbi:hypothetical protein [Methanorbis furvi]|uniref:Uncharacterized protein n=1 Tax=Methanorbis furvi TaxID=3028299 RepID=A0AAE4MAQ0_9EURY|nr:hypothetical protein [Methanocorpusculaceae archaeon Ag1]
MQKLFIIIGLIVCCIAVGAVSAGPITDNTPFLSGEEMKTGWKYTDTYTKEVPVKNIFGSEVGKIILSGYFRYNGVDTPEGVITEQYAKADSLSKVQKTVRVVPYYNTLETKLTLQAEATTDMIIPLHRHWYLWIDCTKDGEVTSGYETF